TSSWPTGSRHATQLNFANGRRSFTNSATSSSRPSPSSTSSNASPSDGNDADIARPSPLKHRNLNVLGRYSFTASTPAAGALRPLRDPDAAGLDDDEDDAEN
ncbi:MAG TPA: hypothetical protein VM347_07195, partial [Nonomuraea sp.]|nr:hypothetical protein [Nonomuraea sp.]